jgi:hypothetical protein
MSINFSPIQKEKSKLKMALTGPSGSGKTLSALFIAQGITDDHSIAIIDTENSVGLYEDFCRDKSSPDKMIKTCVLPDNSPESDINAINAAENGKFEVLIIDSISPCWEYLLDVHAELGKTSKGNSYTDWRFVTPRHDNFIRKIIYSPLHIICTMRSKQDYILVEINGKNIPRKVGMKPIQRDGVDYEFSLVLDLDLTHYATASKDRTSLFMDKESFIITPDVGTTLFKWCNKGKDMTSLYNEAIKEFAACTEGAEWNALKNGKYAHIYLNLFPRIQNEYNALKKAIAERKSISKS